MKLLINKEEVHSFVTNILKECKADNENFRKILSETLYKKSYNKRVQKAIQKLENLYEKKRRLQYLVEIAKTHKSDKVKDEIFKILKEESSHFNTGINVLEQLLKKIVPLVEKDFKMLTTSREQRDSYRSHLLNAIKNMLAGTDLYDDKDFDVDYEATPEFGQISEEIDVSIGDRGEDVEKEKEKFIDVNLSRKPYGYQKKEKEKEIEFKLFSLENQEETGRNVAFDTFKKIQTTVLDSYKLLSAEIDKKMFYEYLVTNLKLYFDRFEEDISLDTPEEPTTEEYEEEKEKSLEDYKSQQDLETEYEPDLNSDEEENIPQEEFPENPKDEF